MSSIRSHAHQRGTALVLVIVVSVIISALVCSLSWVASAQSQNASNVTKMDQAFYAAESGAERLKWFIKHAQTGSISSPLTGTINGDSYSTTWSSSSNTYTVSSTGTYNTIVYSLSQSVTAPSTMGQLAAVSTVGTFDGKNISITGDVISGTDFSEGGSGSVSGTVYYYGSDNGYGGTNTQLTGSMTAINMTTLGTALIAAAGTTYTGDQTNKTFDFTAVPGPSPKVIYVNGNVSSPSFVGQGTLYVNGTISVGAFGTSSNPVSLVASGDITTSNNITMYGNIYTAGNWDRGKFSLTGLIYCGGVAQSNNGSSSLVQGAAPWFDTRQSGGGGSSSGSLTVSNFTGPGI